MHYAGFYNLSTGSKDSSRAASAAQSRRTSEKSIDSTVSQSEQTERRSSIKKALDLLRPYEMPTAAPQEYEPAMKIFGMQLYAPVGMNTKQPKQSKEGKQEQRLKWNTEKARYDVVTKA